MKICTIIGTRPQIIKTCLFSNKVRQLGINEILINTGQHFNFEMSDIFFKELNIPIPDYNMNIGGTSSCNQIGNGIIKLEEILLKEIPDMVIVFGDTNSTLIGALTANKLNIPIAHIESGMRCFDRTMPEEMNRVITDNLSQYLFCPSQVSYQNLAKEHLIKPDKVIISGDVMLDVLIEIIKNIDEVSVFNRVISICETVLKGKSGVVNKYEYVLATVHRAENTDNIDRLKNIIEALAEISNDIPIIFPIHPRTRKVLDSLKLNIPENLIIIDPVGYKEILVLEKNAKLIITDSGGIQKEAYFFKKPSIILRDRTEWTEIVDCGYAQLITKDEFDIKPDDIKVDTYRRAETPFLDAPCSGVRLLHIPSGTVVHNDSERVVHENMRLATSKLRVELEKLGYKLTFKNQIIKTIRMLLEKDFSSKQWDTFYGVGHATNRIIQHLIGE